LTGGVNDRNNVVLAQNSQTFFRQERAESGNSTQSRRKYDKSLHVDFTSPMSHP
jgi:hypothetical protein